MLSIYQDDHFMRQALLLAEQAYEADEVPIGAVVVAPNYRIIGKGYNQVEQLGDPTAHAEMLAITAACNYLGSKFLEDCTLFVSIEPCLMCAGAIKWARLKRIVWGADEPKFGFSQLPGPIFSSDTELSGGVMAEEARQLMRQFFREKRR